MPSLSINFNPAVGPLLQLVILPPNFTSTLASQPNLQYYFALLDTGASHTCISAKVIKDLALAPIGKRSVGGVHGLQATNLFQFEVGLLFPQAQSATGMTQANLMTFPSNGTEFVNTGCAFDVLLGRNILCRSVFSMSFDGHAVLSV